MSYADVRSWYEDHEEPAECGGCGALAYDCEPCEEYLRLRLEVDAAFEGGYPSVPLERLRLLEAYRRGETWVCPHGHGTWSVLEGCPVCEDLAIDEAIRWEREQCPAMTP